MIKRAVFSLYILLFLLTIHTNLLAQDITNLQHRFSITGTKEDRGISISTYTFVPLENKTVAFSTAPSTEMQPRLTPSQKAGDEFLDFLQSKKILFFTKERWLKMREHKEGGYGPRPEVSVSTGPAKPVGQPLPPGLSVELPYESQLSISGRKTIGVSLKSTIYEHEEDQKRTSQTSFDMTQELQVRIKGRVGRKINVNVDFDDTSADKRDISVIYKGDPDEVVQEAAFGDIAMSLPSTEFVGYSRQLFGIKLHTKYKGLQSWGFFSRTKGESEVKRFTGNTQLVRKTIADTAYIPLKYYLARFGSDAIKNGTVKVYVDDRNRNNNNINTSTNTIVETRLDPMTTKSATFTGDFDLLIPGQDYTVDYDRGVIIFRNTVVSHYVIAIDYQRQDGTWLHDDTGRMKMIKDERNTTGITRELKTFYNLGNLKIIRDNGRGNFILEIQDLNGDKPTSLEGGKSIPHYTNSSNSEITVDFESGVFYFEPPDGLPFHDELYNSKKHLYNIFVEYRYRVKIISLQRFGIVPQSERVSMDGSTLERDIDYFIDYDAGILTLFNEEKINENTVIEISYDYAPFGSAGGSTLVGTRSELSLTNNIFIGGTFIYDFSAKTLSVPDIRTTPSSLMVYEIDSRFQNIEIPFTPLKLSLGGEYAQSRYNPNLMDKALIESMEGIKQEDVVSLYHETWKPAVNPSAERYYLSDIQYANEEVARRDINPSLDPDNQEKQQVLSLHYDLSRSTELSIANSISNIGVDYSKKLFLEMWLWGDAKGEEFLVSYGSFGEDADGDGVLDSEDSNGDGTLNKGEDVGWSFNNPDSAISSINIQSKIDTEDLDNDGIFDSIDTVASPGPYGAGNGKVLTDIDGNPYSGVTWTGWKLFRIPLNITNLEEWKTIKQLRLTIKDKNNSKHSGNIKIAGIALVNNRWEIAGTVVTGSSLTIAGINNEDNTNYVSLKTNPEYQSLYNMKETDSITTKEQALSLQYTVMRSTTTELATKLIFGRPYDLSNYKYFRVFAYGTNATNDTFFIQVGNDTNYYEYSTIVNWVGWKLISIEQLDINADGQPDRWIVDGVSASSTVIRGTPNLNNISQLKVGIRAKGPNKTGEIWVNEIHMAESRRRSGGAWRLNSDITWPGWFAAGGKRKSVDRNFQTFSAGIFNRDLLEDSGYLNLTRIHFLPLNTTLNRTRTLTPSVVQNQQGDLVSILEEGRVITYAGSAATTPDLQKLFLPATRYVPVFRRLLPTVGGSYSRAITDSHQIERLEDKETLNGNLSYTFPLRTDSLLPIKTGINLFPNSVSGNYSLANSFFKVYPSSKIIDSDSFLALDTLNKYLQITDFKSVEIKESWSANTPFQIYRNFNIAPGYSLSRTREKNKIFDPLHEEYLKAANQNVNLNSNLRIFSWLNPGFSYVITTDENYDLTFNTTTTPVRYPSRTKYIERRSDANITWNFQVRDFVKFKYTESLGFAASYKQLDNDSYENVESSFSIIGVFNDKSLVIRDNLLKPLLEGNTIQYRVKSIIKKDDRRLSGNYRPFEAFPLPGRIAPFKTLSTNFTYTDSIENSYVTGTEKLSITTLWPDLNVNMNQWEKSLWLERWVDNTSINVRHQKKFTTTTHVSESNNLTYGSDLRFRLLKKLDLSFGGNYATIKDIDLTTAQPLITKRGDNTSMYTQTGFYLGIWRLTVRYDFAKDWQEDGTGKTTQDLNTHTATLQTNSDMSFPRGLPIPFTNKTLPLQNRLVFTSTLKFTGKISSINVEKDNTNLYSFNSNADYEISQNFRAALGLGYSMLQNRHSEEENYHTIEGSFRLTIQF